MRELEDRVRATLRRRGEAMPSTDGAMPEGARRRIRRRRAANVALLGILALAAVAVGVNAVDVLRSTVVPAGRPTDVPSPDAPDGVESIRTRVELAPGTYLAERFAVPFRFDVEPGQRWIVWEHDRRLVTPTRFRPGSTDAGEGGVELIAVDSVIDPRSGAVAAAPSDLAAWIGGNPAVDILGERPITVGGLTGVALDLRSEEGFKLSPQIPLVWEFRIGLNAGARTEMYVLEADAVSIVIVPVGPIDRHQRHLADAHGDFTSQDLAFLDTVEFLPSRALQ